MFDLLLVTAADLPKENLPASWQRHIIWVLGVVIVILAGYIAKQFSKKHDQAMVKFDTLIISTNGVNDSLTDVGSKLEKIFDNDRETKWALQNQKESLIEINAEMKTLTDKTESNVNSLKSNTTAVNKLSKKLKCQEEPA